MKNTQKKFSVIMLIIAMIYQALSGLLGGSLLIYDPTGAFMNLPLSFLEGTPFSDFLIPGIILFVLLGIFPSFVVIGLITKPDWKWSNEFNFYIDQHWAWTYSLFISIMLIIWIDVQIMLIGYGAPIQIIYAFLGVVLLIITLLPSVKSYYSLSN